MKRRLVIFGRILMPTMSVLAFVMAGWLWHRSFHAADYFYRVSAAPQGCALRGLGSYRGAVVLASMTDPMLAGGNTGYRMDTYNLPESMGGDGGASILKLTPAFYARALGFGFSRGQLALNLPFAWLFPARTYRAFYIPYYFIMCLAGVVPVRWVWKLKPSLKPAAIMAESGVSPAAPLPA